MKKLLLFLVVAVMLLYITSCKHASDAPDKTQDTAETELTAEKNETKEKDTDSVADDYESKDEGKTNTDPLETGETKTAETIDDLEDIINNDVESTIIILEKEWEDLSSKINTYYEYIENASDVEEYYQKVNDNTTLLCNRMRAYALNYAELIMSEDGSIDDKYDLFDVIYDVIYNDGGDEIYDNIYNGILDDMYEALYTGVLDDKDDEIPYEDWSDARSNEYDNWSDTRSDIYDNWSDLRSDIYEFWSDIRGELWDDDIEKANEIINDFREDISD